MMLSSVHEHVYDGVPYRPRRGQRAGVIAAGPDLSSATERAVDMTRDPNREAADSATQRKLIVSLDDQVHVIGLHAELDHTEASPGGKRHCDTDSLKH
jgi:hypothetical protein